MIKINLEYDIASGGKRKSFKPKCHDCKYFKYISPHSTDGLCLARKDYYKRRTIKSSLDNICSKFEPLSEDECREMLLWSGGLDSTYHNFDIDELFKD